MNNLDKLKVQLKNDVQGFYNDYLDVEPNQIDNITPEYIAKKINGDCTICLCYGCRYFTHNCKGHITKDECKNFIIDYFSRDYNPDVDDCQCPSCRTNRGEDTDKHYWKLSYKNKECVIYETSLPEAKSLAINKGIYNKEDYPYIVGKINDEKNINFKKGERKNE